MLRDVMADELEPGPWSPVELHHGRMKSWLQAPLFLGESINVS